MDRWGVRQAVLATIRAELEEMEGCKTSKRGEEETDHGP